MFDFIIMNDYLHILVIVNNGPFLLWFMNHFICLINNNIDDLFFTIDHLLTASEVLMSFASFVSFAIVPGISVDGSMICMFN